MLIHSASIHGVPLMGRLRAKQQKNNGCQRPSGHSESFNATDSVSLRSIRFAWTSFSHLFITWMYSSSYNTLQVYSFVLFHVQMGGVCVYFLCRWHVSSIRSHNFYLPLNFNKLTKLNLSLDMFYDFFFPKS